MSINHKYTIGSNSEIELSLNISGLDADSTDVDKLSANFYAFDKNTYNPIFTCSLNVADLCNLYHHLHKYTFIKESESAFTNKFVEVSEEVEDIYYFLKDSGDESVYSAIRKVLKDVTENDLNTILGRKDAITTYALMLDNSEEYSETDWQKFFMENEWIFGYGLKYKYLKILQREAHISKTDLDSKNDVITDFLIADYKFTKIVELKKPHTKLFEKEKNRSDSWRLSTDLTDAISQILAQKANWEIESLRDNYTTSGEIITENTYDVECILIIGSLSDIDGTARDRAIKLKTIELYRRNLRNIEILFYDELFERIKFIVNAE